MAKPLVVILVEAEQRTKKADQGSSKALRKVREKVEVRRCQEERVMSFCFEKASAASLGEGGECV